MRIFSKKGCDKLVSTEQSSNIVSQLNQPAILNRLQTIASSLNSPPDEMLNFESFVDWLTSEELAPESVVSILFQLFLARIPTLDEASDVSPKFAEMSASEIIRFLTGSLEFSHGRQSRVFFSEVRPESLLIDVTHTLTFPHNSGIQRVVRCLGRELAGSDMDHQLIEFDYEHQIYRAIKDERATLLVDWERNIDRSAATELSLSEKIQKRFWKVAGKRFRRGIAKITRGLIVPPDNSIRNGRPLTANTVEDAIFIWNHKLLLPEVALEQVRQNCLSTIAATTPVLSTIVVYDFIPLHHPEFCTVTEGFVRYLSMLRHFDQVSCISRAVEKDLEAFMQLVDREKAPVRHDTHYLGGDFTKNEAIKVDPPAIPVVLSVGSIEKRKNHRRMLHAMVSAQRKGSVFKGVFAGNPGWLNEEFLRDLEEYKSQGFNIELERSVSEERLEELYSMASFTLYCSLVEGFGLPIVESVVKGVPCVVSDRGCMKEIALQIGGCRLVNPESINCIASTIVNLLASDKELTGLREEAEAASWRDWNVYARELWGFSTTQRERANPIETSAA